MDVSMVAPQILVGRGEFGDGTPVNVEVTASATIFPDHEQFVTVRLWRQNGRLRVVLKEAPRVPKDQRSIEAWLQAAGREVGAQLDREIVRRRKVLG